MAKKPHDDGGPAFALLIGETFEHMRCMSMRDYFAGKALVAHGAILAAQLEALDGAVGIADDIARACYALADAMLKERAK